MDMYYGYRRWPPRADYYHCRSRAHLSLRHTIAHDNPCYERIHTVLLIIVIVILLVLLLGGGGYYRSRRR
jgi:hypothetical protein